MRNLILALFLAVCLSACHQGGAKPDKVEPTVDTLSVLAMRIQQCSRLYASEYQIRKIVVYRDTASVKGSLLNQRFKVNLPLGQKQIAIPVTATVKAYVDFGNFSEQNVHKHGDKIEIVLPDPEIVLTSTQIDHQGIHQKVELFRSRFSDSEITRIQQQGRNQIVKGLPALGIVEDARRSAARQLIPILADLGYKEADVTITFRKRFAPGDYPTLIRNKE